MALGHSILAWGMLVANGMPKFKDRGELGECWHGECRVQESCQPFRTLGSFLIVGMGNAGSNSYAKTLSGLGSLPILAWLLLQECSTYWHGMCYQQLPCQKKSSIRVNFVLDISTKIWYNRGLDFWKWGACAEKSFSKFYKNQTIGFFLVVYNYSTLRWIFKTWGGGLF